MEALRVIDLGRMSYDRAYEEQCRHVDDVLRARETGAPEPGRLLLVEHDPVVTLGRRARSIESLAVAPEALRQAGVELVQSDRGGDITYHGPGQLVAYPIVDLNRLRLGLHDYMRALEGSIIEACARFGVRTGRDPCATGVWTVAEDGSPRAKICAMGVRVRRWVTMHGLALNVTTDLAHFGYIVPCGLVGREVTSLRAELGDRCPTMRQVREIVSAELASRLARPARAAQAPAEDSHA